MGVRGVLLSVLVLIGGGDRGSLNLETFISGPGLLIASPPCLFEVCLILVQKVTESNFELLVELCLLSLDLARPHRPVDEVLGGR